MLYTYTQLSAQFIVLKNKYLNLGYSIVDISICPSYVVLQKDSSRVVIKLYSQYNKKVNNTSVIELNFTIKHFENDSIVSDIQLYKLYFIKEDLYTTSVDEAIKAFKLQQQRSYNTIRTFKINKLNHSKLKSTTIDYLKNTIKNSKNDSSEFDICGVYFMYNDTLRKCAISVKYPNKKFSELVYI